MYAAVDVGGTKTLVAVFDDKGEIVEKSKFPTPSNYEEFLKYLADNVAKLSTKDFRAIGLAIPGKVDRTEGIGIAFGNLPWSHVHIQDDVEKIFHSPVVIENDANLAGLSEAILLKGKYRKVLYITVSTGIGGVLVVDEIMDPNTLDAEVGHILLEHKGQLQRWEEFASGSAIVRHFGKKASEIDPEDAGAWYLIARNIAIGLIDLIATLTPEVIILGGGVGSNFEKYGDRLKEELKIYEHPLLAIPPVLKAARAEEAVIYGCYDLTRQKYGDNR